MKHKRKHSKKHSRRRVSGGVGAIDLTTALATVAGAIGGKLIDKVVPKTSNPKIVAGAKIAVGLMLPVVSKGGSTKKILSDVGTGLLVVGSMDLLKSFGVLNGIAGNDEIAFELAGIEDLNTVNGMEDLATVNAPEFTDASK